MQWIDSSFDDRVLMAALMASAGVHALVLACLLYTSDAADE